MQYHDFIVQVMEEAEYDDTLKAEKISLAVLGTIGELLAGTERRHLEAQLPKELKAYVRKWQNTHDAERLVPNLPPEKIVNRIQSRSELNHRETVKGIFAVMNTLRRAISDGEFKELHEKLVSLESLLTMEARQEVTT